MKRIIRLLSITAAAAAIVSCNGKGLEVDNGEQMPDPGPEVTPEATLSFSKTEIEIGGSKLSEGEATLITNQTVFSATTSEDWLEAKFEGKILKAVAAKSNDTKAERTATITVTAGKDDNTATATISVKQLVNDGSGDEKTVLTVADPNALLKSEANSTAEVTFDTNRDNASVVVPEDAQSWLKAEISDSKVVFTALAENSTGAIREAKVTLSAGEGEDVQSVEITVKQQTATPQGMVVGALYEGGMIFEITEAYVKVISLNGAQLAWSSAEASTVSVGTDSNPDDGIDNTNKIKALANFATDYPAAKWCVDQGEGWYMPSRRELNTFATAFSGNWDAANAFLESYGGSAVPIDQYHLTCCEKNESQAWSIKPVDKKAFSGAKATARYVRAIKKIAIQ